MLGIGLMVAGGVSVAMLPNRGPAPSPPAVTAEELSAPPTQVAVVDGGTLKLRDRVVRLLGVAPPARGTSCGERDGAGQDCGAAATNALAAMVRDLPIACRITGVDRQGRAFGICLTGGTELNAGVVSAGWARAATADPNLQRLEQAARAQGRGVWALRSDASW